MKKSSPIYSLVIITIIIAITIINTSCKKDRIEVPEEKTLNEYNPVNQYLDSKKQQEQEFIITGPSNDTITGNQGTKVIGGKNCLQDANGDTIDYPFSIHLVELYTPKDMIYWQMPTVAGGNILETDGEIRIRATENGQELTLSCPYQIWIPNTAPNSSMTIFTGADNGNFIDWSNTTTPFSLISYGYSGIVNSLGWLNADIQIGTGSGNTLTFTSQVDDLTNVGIFIYIPASKTVMQVYNMTSGLIPNGSSIKIIMMAQDANGQLFSYTDSRTVNSSSTIDISLSQTTDAALTSHLNGL
ncbi:MAG: hypothetical protein JKY30_13495 [Flavobacteriales bacterium]|nr:hypothetical protein [Flavobacteriales bacterium]